MADFSNLIGGEIAGASSSRRLIHSNLYMSIKFLQKSHRINQSN